ncbi:TM0106 family RecB-like putative nuclease [Isoptericola variabilis]|uniref:RecB family nuclease, putative n=1 Tax=Isoptericola variabilis (strain 225) TaxID=743718 RepID=F6FR85_ISOV2|nr:TM0106 family RecB-like putative nuclease [Isoptericola variabilis]AEG42945.1 RecB family nuclease, putative [Isoptericola variabilis 225]TWH31803.1 uncharacterized protein L600_002000000120 [Isoptericola variabilis J7]
MFLLEHDGPPGAPDGGPLLVHSAGDLVLAAECEFALLSRLDEVLGRVPRRERPADEMLARTAAVGQQHEERVLAELVGRFGRAPGGGGPGGVVAVEPPRRTSRDELVAAHARTLGAMEAGADVVYQASFFDGRFHGRADFLVREAVPDAVGQAGGLRYAVWDTKLARREKVRAVLQLAAYADQLRSARIDPTEHAHLVLGTRTETHHLLAEVMPVFRARRERMLAVVDAHLADEGPVEWGDPRFAACGSLARCPDCAEAAARARDVLLVGGVYAPQRAVLAEAGLTTIDALAAATEPPSGMPAARFERLRFQAALQLGTEPGDGRVRYEVESEDGPQVAELRWAVVDREPIDRLPAPSPGDVFFDFEGDPLWTDAAGEAPSGGFGLDYLFGWVTREPDDEGRPAFTGLWADDPAEERRALVTFVDWLTERRRRWPDLHVYHYADYERAHLLSIAARHGVYEDEVDQLLRDGVLVDLWNVVRPSLRVSDRSRSIKKLEPLYMADDPAREGVKDAASSVVEYAEYTALRDAGRLEEAEERRRQILEYNRYDCLSTLRLLDWLRAAVPDAGAPDGAAAAQEAPAAEEAAELAAEPTPRQLDTARRIALETEIHALVEAERGTAPDAELRALSLLGSAVGYYRREAKPLWHEHYARLELSPDEWPGRRSALMAERVTVLREWGVEDGRRVLSRDLRVEGRLVEGSELGAGTPAFLLYDRPVPPVVGELDARAVRGVNRRAVVVDARRELVPASDGEPGRTVERDVLVVRESLGAGMDGHDALPMAVATNAHVPCDAQEQAVEDAAAAALRAWREAPAAGGAGRLPAGPAVDLLLRRPPRLVGSEELPPALSGLGDDLVDVVHDAVTRLDRSYLAVQGPPGTGKTYVGSHVVARLVAAGWRVGVVAQSHAVVENLLAAAVDAGVPLDAIAKKARDAGRPGAGTPSWSELAAKELERFAAEAGASGRGCVVGGTAWDFANERWPEEGLDLLVVDEAGQFSVANTIAVARAARRLLLLGDPQQLPQVSKGAHPEPAVAGSALRWLADGHDVLPEALGYFLPASRRMHPALADAVSHLAYSGRLGAHPVAAERRLEGVEPGVHEVLVEHAGRSGASPEEADEVVRQVRAVVGRTWHPGAGEPPRALRPSDAIVVAAYNAQVWTVRRALDAAGLGEVPVGTVDMFQGREAVVAILTLAASAPGDVPRGMRFLLSRNRVNVAVSRGQWCAVVVRSPHLTDYLPGSVRELEQLGAFLRLTSR